MVHSRLSSSASAVNMAVILCGKGLNSLVQNLEGCEKERCVRADCGDYLNAGSDPLTLD